MVDDISVESEGARGESGGCVGLNVGVGVCCGLSRAVTRSTVTVVLLLYEGQECRDSGIRAVRGVWAWHEEVRHIKVDVEICDYDLLFLVLLPSGLGV